MSEFSSIECKVNRMNRYQACCMKHHLDSLGIDQVIEMIATCYASNALYRLIDLTELEKVLIIGEFHPRID